LINLADNALYSTPKSGFTAIDHTETSTVLSTDNVLLTSSGILCAKSFCGCSGSEDPQTLTSLPVAADVTEIAIDCEHFIVEEEPRLGTRALLYFFARPGLRPASQVDHVICQ